MQNFSILQYCSERTLELKSLQDHLDNRNQSQPINVNTLKRKRTGSFRRRVLPLKRRLFQRAVDQFSKNNKASLKRCRRELRRIEHKRVRSSSNYFWLTKRMKMKHLWDSKLPYVSSSTSARSALRTATDGTLVHDMSYLQPIVLLSDDLSNIPEFLTHFMDPDSSVLAALSAITTSEYSQEPSLFATDIQVLLYEWDKFPDCLIGPANITVLPMSSKSNDTIDANFISASTKFKVLLWLHPAIKHEVTCLLSSASVSNFFCSKVQLDMSNVDRTGRYCAVPTISRLRVVGNEASRTLSRVLQTPIMRQPQPLQPLGSSQKPQQFPASGQLSDPERVLSRRAYKRMINLQRQNSSQDISTHNFFKFALSLPLRDVRDIWPSGRILSVNIRDPRFLRFLADYDYITSSCTSSLAAKNTTKYDLQSARLTKQQVKNWRKSLNRKKCAHSWPHTSISGVTKSPLWTDSGRQSLELTFTPNHIINQALHEERITMLRIATVASNQIADFNSNLTFGASNSNNTNEFVCLSNQLSLQKLCNVSFPVLVSRIDSSQTTNRTITTMKKTAPKDVKTDLNRQGILSVINWDLALPSIWMPALWNTLQLAGCKTIGVAEWDYIQTCSGVMSFPRDYPETKAGCKFWEDIYFEKKLENDRQPKNRRLLDCDLRCYIPQWDLLNTTFNFKNTSRLKKDAKSKNRKNESQSYPLEDSSSSLFETVGESHKKKESMNVSLFVIRSSDYLAPYLPFEHNVEQFSDLKGSTKVTGEPGSKIRIHRRRAVKLSDTPPEAPFDRLLVPVSVRPTGRGVPCDGAMLLAPTLADSVTWLTHRAARRDKTLSGCGQRTKSLSDWHGVDVTLEGDERVGGVTATQSRRVIGFITSGQAVTGRMNSTQCVSIGLVDAIGTFHIFQHFWKISSSTDNFHSQNYEWQCTRYTLVLFCNPRSKWLRPALLRYL